MKHMFDRGRSLFTAGAGAALLICTITGHAIAQSTSNAGSAGLLERAARLDVRGVTLEAALSELWQRSGVPLAFSPDLVNGNGSVSCSCTDITVREALDSLLLGTGLTYYETSRRIVVRPATGSVRRAQSSQQSPSQIGTLLGYVRAAPDSQPIAGAQIEVSGHAGELRTNRQGQFRMTLPAGAYDLTVRALGFAPRQLSDLPVVAGDTNSVTVFMNVAPLRLQDIVVTPSTYGILREDRVIIPQSLTRQEVQTRPHTGEDIYRAVDRLPGVTTDDISARLTVRGGPNDQVLSILDGLELYEPFHLKDIDGALSIIDVESVNHVELITGGFAAQYGDKLTGVLSMESTTPRPDRTTTTLGLSFMNATFKNQGGFAGGRGTWLASARRGYLDLVLDITNAADGDERISPVYYDVFGKVQYQLSSRHLLSGHVLHAGDKMSLVEDDATELESDWDQSYGWVNWRADFTDALSANTTLSIGRVTRKRLALDPSGYDGEQQLSVEDRSTFNFYGFKQDWSLLVSPRWIVKWGIDLKRGSADYDYFRWRRSLLPNKTNPFAPLWTPQFDTVTVVTSPTGHEAGLYLSHRLRPVDPLTTEIGLRYDYHSHTGDRTVGPRVNAALELGPGTVLRGAWGFFYQSQALQELDAADGDDRFYPAQRAEHRIVGMEHRLRDGTSLRIEAYERRISDPRPEYRSVEPQYEPVWEEGPEDRVRLEPTRGLARGIEVLARRDVGGRFAWSVSYALASAEDEIDGEWVPRPYDQRHTLRLEAAYRPSASWSMSWAWQYHSPWPGTPGGYTLDTLATGDLVFMQFLGRMNSERLPAYHRFDARLSRHFPLGRGRLSVYLDVFNLYDRENAKSFNYRIDGLGGTQFGVVRTTHELLGLLPTVGARWEF